LQGGIQRVPELRSCSPTSLGLLPNSWESRAQPDHHQLLSPSNAHQSVCDFPRDRVPPPLFRLSDLSFLSHLSLSLRASRRPVRNSSAWRNGHIGSSLPSGMVPSESTAPLERWPSYPPPTTRLPYTVVDWADTSAGPVYLHPVSSSSASRLSFNTVTNSDYRSSSMGLLSALTPLRRS